MKICPFFCNKLNYPSYNQKKLTMNISIVLGMGFGDEGKGAFVNYLCGKVKNPLVIRFNGGHQVGHTVVVGDKRHVFSNFGSGTLSGAHTYWSEYCTVSPNGVMREGKVLRDMGLDPHIVFNGNAMITTPFDILKNHVLDGRHNHGSVGVGFGTTIQRNEDHYHLYVRDLKFPAIRDAKIRLLQEKYYGYITPDNSKTKTMIEEFKVACDDLVKRYDIVNNINISYYNDIIFEGGQGIMLDTNYGFFPHVTRSNTTSKNALEIFRKNSMGCEPYLKTYYVTRAYQTRHGNGPMTNEGLDTSHIKDNPLETNVDGFQGEFRKSVLDMDLLRYAFECDLYYNPKSSKNIVVTCLDQVPEDLPVTHNNELITIKTSKVGSCIGIHNQLSSYSDKGVD